MRSMLKYFISLVGCTMMCMNLHAQQDSIPTIDSLVIKKKYGIRLGVDLSKIARSFLESDYSGLELNGDYRLTNKLYISSCFLFC